jgi:hypothetical protein
MPSPADVRPTTGHRLLPLGPIAALAAFFWWPRAEHIPALGVAFLAASGGLFVWWAWLAARLRRKDFALVVEVTLPHVLQTLAYASILVYWSWYWQPIADAAPLIAAQIVFALAFDMLLSWSRRHPYSLGLEPFSLVFAINLFLRFVDDRFALQFALIAVGLLARELIRWQRDGQRVAIFSPASFSLAVASVVLLTTQTTSLTWGAPISTELFLPPQIYLFIFAVALPGAWLSGLTMVTLSAVVTTYAFSAAYLRLTGTYFFIDSHVPIAFFLAMHVLVGDASTLPRSTAGRVAFGVLYGLAAVGLYTLLSAMGAPTFYAKLLPVPLISLLVRLIDRWTLAAPIDPAETSPANSRGPMRRRLAYTALWIVVFGALSTIQAVGDAHPGHSLLFWKNACTSGHVRACRVELQILAADCGKGSPWACHESGVVMARQHLGSDTEIRRAFDTACAAGFDPGCRNRFQIQSGQIRSADPNAADYPILLATGKGVTRAGSDDEILSRGCESGWVEACGLRGLMLVASTEPGPGRRAEGIALLTRACDAGHAQSCSNLAFAYKRGDGVVPSLVKMRELLQRACELGMADACAWLAVESAEK